MLTLVLWPACQALLAREQHVLMYCDLHSHSRSHNVFMYGVGEKRGGRRAAVARFPKVCDTWPLASCMRH